MSHRIVSGLGVCIVALGAALMWNWPYSSAQQPARDGQPAGNPKHDREEVHYLRSKVPPCRYGPPDGQNIRTALAEASCRILSGQTGRRV